MKSVIRRYVLPLLGVVSTTFFFVLACTENITDPYYGIKPNIIFILTDDQGWGDGKSFGHPYIQTDNIDRIAAEGAWFRQFYVSSPVCSPSRVAFVSGNFPAKYGIHAALGDHKVNKKRGMPDWLDADTTTIWDLMKSAGYATAHFGKWHMGHAPGAPEPGMYGIDQHRTTSSNGPGWDMSDPYFRAHSTGLFVDETIEFIKSSARNNKPFYVNLWTLIPHAPLMPTEEELARYDGLTVDPDDFSSYMKDYVLDAADMQAQMKVYLAALTGMDEQIGRLLDFLDKSGLSENTIIFFASDNGPEDYHANEASNPGMGSPGPYRGRKRSLYEGGIRTPLLVRWPGKIKAGRQDEQSVLGAVDLLPTLSHLAGVDVSDIDPDGENISDILFGSSRPRRKPLFWEWRSTPGGNPIYNSPQLAVRKGKWKLFINADRSRVELYDISTDPEEWNNLKELHPELVNELLGLIYSWRVRLHNNK